MARSGGGGQTFQYRGFPSYNFRDGPVDVPGVLDRPGVTVHPHDVDGTEIEVDLPEQQVRIGGV